MIKTENGITINTFRDLYKTLPPDLKQILYRLWTVPQNPKWHPEGNTLKHVITVANRAIRLGDADILLAALFHDLGKFETLAFNIKTRQPSAHGHEKVSATRVKEYRKYIKSMGANPVIVYYLVRQHMRVKNLDDMRKKKQEFMEKNPNVGKLKSFMSIDRGGLTVEQRIVEYQEGDAMPIPDEVRKLATEFKKSGKVLYVVGGAVRDFMLDKSPKDYDLATDAHPDDSLKIIRKLGYKTLEVGKSFGVVIAIPPSGEEYEIATFREDIGSGRRPDSVRFADIGTDVKRRDLTINALFYDIDSDKVVDLVGGISDLETGTIKTVGDPNSRFDEDKLRKLRALRFYARLGKTIDPKTLDALKDTSLEGVSAERVRDEFMKSIKTAKSPRKYLILADKLGYMDDILGNMQYSSEFIDSSDPIVQLGALLAPESTKVVNDRLSTLKYTRDETRNVVMMLEFLKTAKNEDFDRVYALFRGYKHISRQKMEEFGSEMGISRFVTAVGKIDMRQIDVASLSKIYKKKDLGNAIKDAVESQFRNIY
jgi:tRNA nucleotidyltransferase/poly(A) polymerase